VQLSAPMHLRSATRCTRTNVPCFAASGGGPHGDITADVPHTVQAPESCDANHIAAITSLAAVDDNPGVATVYSFEATEDEVQAASQPGPPAVPRLTASQMLAAKREQQRSMIAYTMQVCTALKLRDRCCV
jgi:hypothetical protein